MPGEPCSNPPVHSATGQCPPSRVPPGYAVNSGPGPARAGLAADCARGELGEDLGQLVLTVRALMNSEVTISGLDSPRPALPAGAAAPAARRSGTAVTRAATAAPSPPGPTPGEADVNAPHPGSLTVFSSRELTALARQV